MTQDPGCRTQKAGGMMHDTGYRAPDTEHRTGTRKVQSTLSCARDKQAYKSESESGS